MSNLPHGREHEHCTLGRIMVIHCHPHDGACLIIEAEKPGYEDELMLTTCERSDLQPSDGESLWPFLGRNCKARQSEARARNKAQEERLAS